MPANNNCFWASLLGRSEPFSSATRIRHLRQEYIDNAELLLEDRMRLVEGCDVFLKLFQLVHIDRAPAQAEALAPLLNRHVPELMARCPAKELRPTPQQLADVRDWYMVDEKEAD